MKIPNTPELPGAAAQAAGAARQQPRTAGAAQAKAAAPAPAPAPAAQNGAPVTLSRAAQSMEPYGRLQGDFDAGRVKSMRAAIEGGTFKVNAGNIADKLLANAQEVLARSRG